MLGPVAPTPYDLQFPLLGIPVRVSPWFWGMAAILGWPLLQEGWPMLLLFIFAAFVSILVHEFGHALTARAFGHQPRVLLYQFGGLAMYAPTHRFTLGRSILIVAAGPLAGLVLGGIAFGALVALVIFEVPVAPQLEGFLSILATINFSWSLLNLLPVLPLDGGQILRDVLLLFTRSGLRIALIVGLLVGAAVAIYGFTSGQIFLAVMFGAMAGGCLNDLQQRSW